MMFIVLGTMEVCQRMLLRESAAVAAYETARLAARRTVTVAKAQARGEQILTARQVNGGTVEITPGTLNTLPTGSELQVRVRVPIAGNSSLHYVLPVTGELEVVTTMLRE
jgi:hypothetical protein